MAEAKHLGRNATLQLSETGRTRSLDLTDNASGITAVLPHHSLKTVDSSSGVNTACKPTLS